MSGGKAAEKAQTILQRFLLGSADDGLCRMPLVLGVSATPRRFETLLAGTTHTVHKVYVPADAVRQSGLLKDRILIHYPDAGARAEMTLLAEAAGRWQQMESRWGEYCKREGESPVWPILVMQVEDDGRFLADLGTWEREVLEEELQDAAVVAWLRNLDRKPWSLEIPYRLGGTPRPMYPDLLVVRQGAKGFLFDILEPHDPTRDDNHAKAVGLAEFAERHWHLFDRIQLIRKKKGPEGKERYYRLDIGKQAVRKKVLTVISNHQLDQIFDQEAG